MAVDIIAETLERASVGRPITRAGVSLFPVYLHRDSALDHLPGVTALAEGLVELDEVGAVGSLRLSSRAAKPILFPEGDTLVGGWQNRTLDVTVLVGAREVVEIPVACVEAGRWGKGRRFSHGRIFVPRKVRRAKVASLSARVAAGVGRRSDQRAVWNRVEDELRDVAAHAPTAAIHDAVGTVTGRLAELRDRGPLPGQHGVVVTLGRRVVAVELFARPQTLAAYWPSMIDAYAFDAESRAEGRASAADALEFLGVLAGSARTERPGVGLGTELHITGRRIVAHGLRVDDVLVHLSAFDIREETP